MSEDPIGFDAGDVNLNRFVGNAPTTRLDPIGLRAPEDDEISFQQNRDVSGLFSYFTSDLRSDQWSQPAGYGTGHYNVSGASIQSMIQIAGTNVCNTITGSINNNGGSFKLRVKNLQPGVYEVVVHMTVRAEIGGGGRQGTAFAGGTFHEIGPDSRQLASATTSKQSGKAAPPFSFDAASAKFQVIVRSTHPVDVLLFDPSLRIGSHTGFARVEATAQVLNIRFVGRVEPKPPRNLFWEGEAGDWAGANF